MGQGFNSNCYNDWGEAFTGTDVGDQCMYDTGNLDSLPVGSSSYYVEMKDSGTCFFEPSYLLVGFAQPGTAPGEYNFIFGLSSQILNFTEDPPWVLQEVSGASAYNIYMWTLPGGIPAQIQGILQCGEEFCINWLIPSSAAVDKAPPSASFKSLKSKVPEDGSDYHGPSKK